MDHKKLNAGLAAVITALAEEDSKEAPEGHIYMALNIAGYTLSDFNALRAILVEAGLVARKPGPVLSLTKKGEEVAAKIEAAMKKEAA